MSGEIARQLAAEEIRPPHASLYKGHLTNDVNRRGDIRSSRNRTW